jgi:hypothetical protein
MKKKLIGIFVCMLMITTMISTIIAKDIDNTTISKKDDGYLTHQPGNTIEGYDLLNTKKVAPLFPKKQSNIPVSFENNIVELIEQIDEAMIHSYMENLTSFGPRLTTTETCEDAGAYLYSEFKNMGLDVRYDNWSYAANYKGSNIEATLPGSNPESDCIFVVCAHYDSVAAGPGAGDDADGCAAVLAAANIMSHYSFNHTVRFLLTSGEEQGALGAYYNAEEAYQNYEHIIGVLNLDSISYATNEVDASKVHVFQNQESSWLTTYTTNIAQTYLEYINLEVIPTNYCGVYSDIHKFYQFSYDGIWYFDYGNSPYWHTPDDVVQNCNMTYAKRISRLMLATLASLAQSYQEKSPVDIPIWKVGDQWTYRMDFYLDFGTFNKQIFYGTSNRLVYTVVKDSGDDYVLNFKGPFSGWIKADFIPIASMRITKLSKVTGNLIVQKSNLAIKEYSIKINGISFPMIGKIPIVSPIPYKVATSVKFSPAFCILPFPIYDGKYGNLPDCVQNHTSAYISFLFGKLLKFDFPYDYIVTNLPYRCEKELITVPAGTYDTCKVSIGLVEQPIESYYAPEVGNIVKFRIWECKWAFPNEPEWEIEQELLSTIYTPDG